MADNWEDVRFGGCAGRHYPGTNGGCVIMAGGFAVTRGPGTERFAKRFHDAGFSVLAFENRRLGAASGRPRQVVRIREQLADWRAAIAYAGTLPQVDPARLALWSFSLTGGLVLQVAARNPNLAAVIAQSPNADGPASTRSAMRYTTPSALLRLTGRGVLDALGGLVGRPPLLVPLVGPPGTVALLSTPDVLDTSGALDPDGRYADWQRTVAARSALSAGLYRPGRFAAKVRCPLLVVVADQDKTALTEPSVRVARTAPLGELVRLPGGHYAAFLDAHEQAVDAELSFLRRHLLGDRISAQLRGQER
jgi:alpha/beta superfamily hydrolase